MQRNWTQRWRLLLSRVLMVALIVSALFVQPLLPMQGLIVDIVFKLTGFLLVIGAALGRIWCTLYLGGSKNRTVVRDGPYNVVRNPLYVLSFVGLMGVLLMVGSLTLMCIGAAIFILYYQSVVQGEEEQLTQIFGKPYRDYLKQVPRWVPDFSRYKPIDAREVHMAAVISGLRDAVWWFMAWPILGLIETMRLLHLSQWTIQLF